MQPFDTLTQSALRLLVRGVLCCAVLVGGQVFAATPDHEPSDPRLLQRLASSLERTAEDRDRFDLTVWLTWSDQQLARFVESADYRHALLRHVYSESAYQQIDPDLVLAVIEVESAFDRYAVSSAGAQGLMQVMPFWKRELGRNDDNLTDPITNIRYGTAILAHYLNVAAGDLAEALARYNGSMGRLDYPDRVLRAHKRRWQSQRNVGVEASCIKHDIPACRESFR